jgi:hypothetical protein
MGKEAMEQYMSAFQILFQKVYESKNVKILPPKEREDFETIIRSIEYLTLLKWVQISAK